MVDPIEMVLKLTDAVEKLTHALQESVNVQIETSKQMIALGQDNERIRERLDSLERSRDNDSRISRGDGD